ncbi:hypothetical protein BCU94_18480 [Shewanella sp. 10N.286.52.C2]|uniref:DUF6339 family protein n=1 Tax=Shewanella sp. 10N.286.52.C2 TaxID=1880838 RepID=UPI000C861A79|nr:DUF6339 family protein [Shewanella sp. 10N.286.52.C2]PMG28017.1 hypothetical protein BCU94_18480 [Shewanella sp. 10N.286.52.C2]
MEMRLFHQRELAQLIHDIEQNIETYRNGDFNFISEDETLSFALPDSVSIDLDMLQPILDYKAKDQSPANRAASDAKFSSILYKSITGLEPSIARDPRLWNYLSHTIFLNYVRNRYPIPQETEKAIKEIKAHFFCTDEKRSIERNNGVSRLWWMAYVVSRVDELGLDDALKAFLTKTDVRANIFERPTTSQNVNVLTGILKALHQSLSEDSILFERHIFREFMREINLWGGMILIGDLDQEDIDSKLLKIKDKVIKN